MVFNSDDYLPKPRDWFTAKIRYEGWGHAEFANPTGWVEGDTVIEFDDLGRQYINMDVSRHQNDSNPTGRWSLLELLTARKPPNQAMFSYSEYGSKNQCLKFEVTVTDGIFSLEGEIKFTFGGISNDKLRFGASSGRFVKNGNKKAYYWVLPLLNFVSNIGKWTDYFNEHPLRLHKVPNVPDGLSDIQPYAAYNNSRIKNDLAVFEHNGGYGFIERLPNYEELSKQLVEGNTDYAITAIVVGEVGNKSTNKSELKDWFPIEFLDLLSLATGTRVSSPWIEFRDQQGELISRLHKNQWYKRYTKGHVSIDNPIHDGLSELLTVAQSSSRFRNKAFYAALNQLIMGMQDGVLPEDRAAHLFRSFDGLCEMENIYKPSLNPLDAARLRKIKDVLEDAAKEIRIIAKEADNDGKIDESKIIRNLILQRIKGATDVSSRLKFYAAVDALLTKYNFSDVEIMNTYYQSNPRPDNCDWIEALSNYRGVAIHENYFSFDDGTHDYEDFKTIILHVSDLLFRLIFTMLGYEGKYQPPLKRYSADDCNVDWVKPSLTAKDLGYK